MRGCPIVARTGRSGLKLPAISLGLWWNFGRLMRSDLPPFRDELVVSTKAGYDMWPGPYGDHGSREYLLASFDQSLDAHEPHDELRRGSDPEQGDSDLHRNWGHGLLARSRLRRPAD
jgi:hypothetical protein